MQVNTSCMPTVSLTFALRVAAVTGDLLLTKSSIRFCTSALQLAPSYACSYIASKHVLEDISQHGDIVLVLQYWKLLFEFCLTNSAHNVDFPRFQFVC
jgi:hypothetical protein